MTLNVNRAYFRIRINAKIRLSVINYLQAVGKLANLLREVQETRVVDQNQRKIM